MYSDRPGSWLRLIACRSMTWCCLRRSLTRGRLLTSLSLWWFEQLADVMPNHVISATAVPAEFEGRAVRFSRSTSSRLSALLVVTLLGWAGTHTRRRGRSLVLRSRQGFVREIGLAAGVHADYEDCA
ncbi:hypothetical protein [Kribbella sp. NPDC051770]|uniref:hypothetical protein n=1 Tax=Kribbella sp. NPDC051770 TaxID=3155413 RepID=UPI003438718D